MVTQQLLDYIKNEIGRGVIKDDLRQILFDAGWQIADIEEAIKKVEEEAVVSETGPDIEGPLKRKFGKKLVLVVLLLIVPLVLMVVGAYVYFNVYLSPERVLGRMFSNFQEVEKYKLLAEVNLKTTALSFLSGKATNVFIAKLDGAIDEEALKSKTTVELLTEGKSVGVWDFVGVDKDIYVRPHESFVDPLFNLSPIVGNWIKITEEDLRSVSKSLSGSDEEVQEQNERIIQVFEKYQVFEITEKLAEENVDGVKTFHYRFVLNNENFKKAFLEIVQIIQSFYLYKAQPTAAEQVDLVFEQGIFKGDGEIWIGKRDYLLYKVVFNIKFSGTEIKFSLFLKDFGVKPEISTPSEFIELQEAVDTINQGRMEESSEEKNIDN